MIDRMVSDLGERVQNLWCTDKQKTGKYPPPSLQALLQLYLLDGIEEIDKHKITMYLLLDIGWAVPDNRERLLHSFCAAFAIPKGFVQLVQGFWLLDHNDYENSLVLLCHPATARSASWLRQRAIQSLMCQGQHRRALTYIRMTRPLITSSREAQLYLSVFLSNRCMADAWNLLQQRSSDDNREELLLHMFKTCLEMGLVKGFLELPFTDTELECLEEILESSDLIKDHEFFPANHPKPVNNTAAVRVNKSAKVTLTDFWKKQMLKVLPFPRVPSWCSQLLKRKTQQVLPFLRVANWCSQLLKKKTQQVFPFPRVANWCSQLLKKKTQQVLQFPRVASWYSQLLKKKTQQVLQFPRVASWCSKLLRLLPGRLQGKGEFTKQIDLLVHTARHRGLSVLANDDLELVYVTNALRNTLQNLRQKQTSLKAALSLLLLPKGLEDNRGRQDIDLLLRNERQSLSAEQQEDQYTGTHYLPKSFSFVTKRCIAVTKSCSTCQLEEPNSRLWMKIRLMKRMRILSSPGAKKLKGQCNSCRCKIGHTAICQPQKADCEDGFKDCEECNNAK
ncbi:uncharacterized protein LOC128853135 [Cuculus canorus]|nr:uncharacterized protein LOC128853135 [Cuculus canorus]